MAAITTPSHPLHSTAFSRPLSTYSITPFTCFQTYAFPNNLFPATTLAFHSFSLHSGLVMTIGADLAPDDCRSAFLALYRSMSDAGVLLGPLAGGVITDYTSIARCIITHQLLYIVRFGCCRCCCDGSAVAALRSAVVHSHSFFGTLQ